VALRSVLAPPGQVPQNCVQLVDRSNSLPSEVGSAFLQQREHRCGVLRGHHAGVALQGGYARRRGRVDHVVLAAPASGQLPYTRLGGRGDIEHHLVARDEPLREMAAQPLGVFDRSAPLAELAGPAQQPR
jgi:hypothetical protein